VVIGAVGRLLVFALIAVGPGAAPSSTLFRFADPRITEASGIARGLVSPGVFYVQNDSGDTNRFFAVDGRTGATAATITVTGARNVDWEDLAVARDAAGAASVWLADTGDNDAVRHSVQVYRVAEPRIAATERNRVLRVPVAQAWRLRYPGGPADAEALAVAPDGTGYLVTKELGGATVYQLPAGAPGNRVQLLRRVGRIAFHATGTDNPFGPAGQLLATGAAIPADGSMLVVRTYADAWIWPLGSRGIRAALRSTPTVLPLPAEQQGEGITVVGHRLVVDSEGAHSAVAAVSLPPSGSPHSTPPSEVPTSSGPVTPTPSPGGSGSGSSNTPRLLIILVLIGGGFLVVRTATRARRND
jgi:hypothetical protein